MAHETAIRVASASELQTESLRLTAFLAPSVQVSELVEPNWWSDLVGAQPETKTSKPGRGELQEAGPVGDRTLVLSVQPVRVDWFLTPRYEGSVPPETRWAGRFADTLGVFDALMTRWLGMCPALSRLAFGAVVFEPVRDKVAGYRRLAEYLPAVRLDPEGSYDFFYQINRPRNSTAIDGLRINRLSRWSVAQFVQLRFTFSRQSIQSAPAGEGEQACRIELDISTAPEFASELPRPSLPQIFEELKTLATELAAQGDVP